MCSFRPVLMSDQTAQVRMPFCDQTEHISDLALVPLRGMDMRRDGGKQAILIEQVRAGLRHVRNHGSTMCAPKRRVMASNRLAKSDGTWSPIALRAARLITIAADRSTRLRAPTARPASVGSPSAIRST